MCAINPTHLVMTVCLSGRMSNSIFMICGSKPMSNIRSASSSTCTHHIKEIDRPHQRKHTYQVGDTAHTQQFVHKQIIEPTRCSYEGVTNVLSYNHLVDLTDDNLHSLTDFVDLLSPVTASVHTHTTQGGGGKVHQNRAPPKKLLHTCTCTNGWLATHVD